MEPTKFITKAGEEIIIRIAKASDAKQLLQIKLAYLENTTTLPLFQDEYTNDVDNERQLIERLAREKNSILLVAEYQGQLIGNIDLNGNRRRKLFHTGMVGMGILEAWRGKGVGKALLAAVIDWGIANQHLKILWLAVYASNQAGKALYQKLGFREVGKLENFFREQDEYIDKLMMVRNV